MPDDFYFSPKIGSLLKGAKGKFVYLIMAKWYLLVAIPAFWATYYFFDKLEATGIPKKIYDFVEAKLDMIVTITRECTPHIGNLNEYFSCINNIN